MVVTFEVVMIKLDLFFIWLQMVIQAEACAAANTQLAWA